MTRTSFLAAAFCLAIPTLALAQTPGSTPATPYLSEAHARSLLQDSGCSSMSTLSMDHEGNWRGTCQKGGQAVGMVVSQKGKVSPAVADSYVTEAHARSALMAAGCSNVSTLSRGPEESWFGTCQKGGQTTSMMVDQHGKASAANGVVYVSEAHARSALMNSGCSNVSSLSEDQQGTWYGTCQKGGQTVNMQVDQKGMVAKR